MTLFRLLGESPQASVDAFFLDGGVRNVMRDEESVSADTLCADGDVHSAGHGDQDVTRGL